MIRLSTLLISLALSAGFFEAHAADIAQRKIFGFSPQGKYFAFEQFGIQDGSGFPYSDIFIINVKKNSWVKGTPIRTLLHNENISPLKARSASYQKARPILRKLEIGENQLLLASNPMTEISADPKKVAFRAFATDPPFGPRFELTLSEFKLKAAHCDGVTKNSLASGFALHLRSLTSPGSPLRVLARDTSIPKSRGCPLDYAIADVISFEPAGFALQNNESVFAILLYVYAHGFEGRSGRFIAVTASGITG